MNRKGTINSIKGEIHNLLAVLRFLPASCPDSYTDELLDLFQKLLVCSDVDGVDYWSPFLKIIQSPDSSSAIKGVALSSIHKFLLYNFVGPASAYTLNKIVNGVVQCIIETYSSSDEVVLMKLLHVFLECLRAPASVYLTDASVWSISKRCFDIFERERASELLKKTAQNTLLQIFLIVFGRVAQVSDDHENSSYGVLCLKKIILHLAYLIGFTDKTDSNFKEKRCLGLFLMNTALETASENIGIHKELISVIQDEVCKSLLINSATDDLYILTLTLRVVFNLFQSVKQHLKVQQEVFFNSLHLKIAAAYDETGDASVFQRSELALESIVDFCREPTLILELYTNYDCDFEFANLFERLAKFLCKHAFPLNSSLNRLNELCIEGLLAIISSISMRCDPNLKPSEISFEDLKGKKTLKEIYLKSAEIFNSDHKEFIPKLQELNYLPVECSVKDLAKFFKENPAIDHVKLGEYLGSSKEFNKSVLQEFLSLFDFQSLSIDEALRSIFKSCKIPGEAQVIDRVVSYFAHAYYPSSTIIEDESAAYVLAFSIIMLNTDLTSPSVKTKMPVEAYIRNLKGVNGGKDFPEEYLKSVYYSVKNDPIETKEIIRSIEHKDFSDMSSKWGKILMRNTGNYSTLNELLRQPAGENEKLMFDLLWESGLLGTLTSVTDSASTVKSFTLMRDLLVECSKVSAYFGMNDYINKIISILCSNFIKNSESVAQLYSTPRAFYVLEAAVGSAVVAKNNLDLAWVNLISCLLKLHKLKVLPNQLVELDDFVDEFGNALPMATSHFDETFFQYFRTSNHPSSHKSEEEIAEENAGIWSSFVKYLGVPTGSARNNEEILMEMQKEVKDKIHSAGVHILFTSSKTLDLKGLQSFIKCLRKRCKTEPDEVAVVLCIELLTGSIISNATRLPDHLWQKVLNGFERMICKQSYTWTQERALVNLIRITVLHHEDYSGLSFSLQTVLKHLSSIGLDLFLKFAERLAAGLSMLVCQGNASFLCQDENWKVVIKLLENFASHEKTARAGQELTMTLLHYLNKDPNSAVSMYEDLLETVKVTLKKDHKEQSILQTSVDVLIKIFKNVQKRGKNEAVSIFWKKIVSELGKLCRANSHQIRIASYTALQEVILNFTMQDSWPFWKECYEKILFPLVVEPFVISTDSLKGLSDERTFLIRQEFETSREKATALVCQTTLNLIPVMTKAQDFQVFWLRLVKLLAQTLKSKDQVNEKNYEIIKNLFIVIKSENVLTEESWTETWLLVNLDSLKEELNS